MVNIFEKNGTIFLEGDYFDLKIDNNRKVYIKKKTEKAFSGLDEELDVGLSMDEKKKYLYELYRLTYQKLKERQEQQKL